MAEGDGHNDRRLTDRKLIERGGSFQISVISHRTKRPFMCDDCNLIELIDPISPLEKLLENNTLKKK